MPTATIDARAMRLQNALYQYAAMQGHSSDSQYSANIRLNKLIDLVCTRAETSPVVSDMLNAFIENQAATARATSTS